MDDRHESPKEHDILELLFRYKSSGEGRLLPGLDDVLVRYSGKDTLRTRLVPASWSLVLLFAIINAFAISVMRIFWIDTFGRPEIFIHHPELEKERQALLLEEQSE